MAAASAVTDDTELTASIQAAYLDAAPVDGTFPECALRSYFASTLQWDVGTLARAYGKHWLMAFALLKFPTDQPLEVLRRIMTLN